MFFKVISLYELSLNEPKTELYMMMEVMDCDLHRVIQSKQPLSEKHFKCFIKQILEGIKAMHAIGVFHRDLKPGNILVSKDCQLRITDFGLARYMDDFTRSGDNQLNPMTEYVVTRWYRCPELLLSPNRPYNEAIDLWSIGCILAELLRRKPLFPGKSHANQVQLIFEVLGYSNVRELGFPISAEAAAFLDKRCRFRKQPLSKVIPDASPDALHLLESLLELCPDNRPTAAEALEFSFLDGAEVLHDYSRSYLSKPSSDFFDFEKEKYTALELKKMIELEVRLSAAYAYQYGQEVVSLPNVDSSTALNSKNVDAESKNETEDTDQGPASQLATQLRNSKLEKSKENPFRSFSKAEVNDGRPKSSDETVSGINTKPLMRSGSASAATGEGNVANVNILSAIRNSEGGGVPSRSRRSAPKTPSPQKIDAILQKDLNNKKRFALEDLQKQRELDASNYGLSSQKSDSNASASSIDNTKKPSRWNFPTNAPVVVNQTNQGASYHSAFSAQYLDSASTKKSNRMNGVPFPSLSRMSNFGSKSTSVVKTKDNTSNSGRHSTIMHSGSNVINNDHELYSDYNSR